MTTTYLNDSSNQWCSANVNISNSLHVLCCNFKLAEQKHALNVFKQKQQHIKSIVERNEKKMAAIQLKSSEKNTNQRDKDQSV